MWGREAAIEEGRTSMLIQWANDEGGTQTKPNRNRANDDEEEEATAWKTLNVEASNLTAHCEKLFIEDITQINLITQYLIMFGGSLFKS